MEWKQFFQTWRGMAFANRAKDIVIGALLVTILGLTYTVATQDTVVTMNPPPTTETMTISQNAASPKYQQLWAMFVVELVGNITPENAERVRQSLGPFLSPDIRNKVMRAINADIEHIKRDDVVTTFSIQDLRYDINGQGRVYVIGDTTLSGVTDDVKRSTRTYVIDVDVSHYQPVITYFNTHAGEPEDHA